ncbi:MAG: hypothetical protein OXB95_06630 [Rhodobacteraceae bacterium]|nr:hypothetical protein [Paracoccaceae bacterium]
MRATYDYILFLLIRGLVGSLLLLPFRQRVKLGGQVFIWIGALHRRWKSRVLANLNLIFPEMSPSQRREVYFGVMRNFGMTLMELFSATEFRRQARTFEVCGSGLAEIEDALAQGRRVILISGHFGNWEAIRGVLAQRGIRAAVVYKPMHNRFFDRYWRKKIEALGTPAYRSIRPFIAHILRRGGVSAILNDQYEFGGQPLEFLGHTALTQSLLAKVSIRSDALFVPCFGIRKTNKGGFVVHFDKAIPNTTPDKMIQSFNDSLEQFVRKNPEQWLWIHKRWR